jgi:hypothetical protein
MKSAARPTARIHPSALRPLHPFSAGALLLVAAGLSFGCRASVSANLNTGNDKQDEEDFEQPLTPVSGTLDDNAGDADFALIGARHDVALSDAARGQASSCSCLALKLGPATDPGFTWQGPVPRTDPQSQLVFAMSSEGQACAGEPADSLGASYWGFKQDGDDIVIIVENARFGRPLTAGAVIPKPLGNGHVYLRPASKDVPYGKPASGDRYCKLL